MQITGNDTVVYSSHFDSGAFWKCVCAELQTHYGNPVAWVNDEESAVSLSAAKRRLTKHDHVPVDLFLLPSLSANELFDRYGYSQRVGTPGPLLITVNHLRNATGFARQIEGLRHDESDGMVTKTHSARFHFSVLHSVTIVTAKPPAKCEFAMKVLRAVCQGIGIIEP